MVRPQLQSGTFVRPLNFTVRLPGYGHHFAGHAATMRQPAARGLGWDRRGVCGTSPLGDPKL